MTKARPTELEKAELRVSFLERQLLDKVNELKRVRRVAGSTEQQLDLAEQKLHLVRSIKDATPSIPKWTVAPKRNRGKGGVHHGTPTLMLSDLHLGEVVNPNEVEWFNAYDDEIAALRLERTFQVTVELARDYTAGVTFDGIVVPILGDVLTGTIHDELARTNSTTVFETVVQWVPKLAAGLHLLADEFGNVLVPAVAGNHDRSPAHRRVPSKRAAKESIAWIVYQWLADHFRGDPRVRFIIPEGKDALWSLYGTRFLGRHGEDFRGGDGIIGPLGPITRGSNRTSTRNAVLQKPYDLMLLGHFHTLLWGKGFYVNGSLKGYDEYAMTNNFTPEVAQQGWFVTTPEHGVTMQAPIIAQSSSEPWRR